jgi:hypothetical protein
MGFARCFTVCSICETSLHLLPKEDIIEIHRESPDRGKGLDTAPQLERQMSELTLRDI